MKVNCDQCLYYSYDEEYEAYVCEVDLDEDEMMSFLQSEGKPCPYFRFGTEYTIVKKQI